MHFIGVKCLLSMKKRKRSQSSFNPLLQYSKNTLLRSLSDGLLSTVCSFFSTLAGCSCDLIKILFGFFVPHVKYLTKTPSQSIALLRFNFSSVYFVRLTLFFLPQKWHIFLHLENVKTPVITILISKMQLPVTLIFFVSSKVFN